MTTAPQPAASRWGTGRGLGGGLAGLALGPARALAMRSFLQSVNLSLRDANGVAHELGARQIAGMKHPAQPLTGQARLFRCLSKPDQPVLPHAGRFYALPLQCSTNLVGVRPISMVQSSCRTAN